MFGPSLVKAKAKEWKFVSIDIETLGLDENYCDIIEFGAVLDDLDTPLEDLPRYHCYLTNDKNRYQGEIAAMAMHGTIFKRIASREKGYNYIPTDILDENFSSWLKEHGLDKIVIIGKNFANFDLKFLQKIGFGNSTNFHRRILDVGSMFYDSVKDIVPPNLEECLRRARVEKTVEHTAVEDALDVLRCVRYKQFH